MQLFDLPSQSSINLSRRSTVLSGLRARLSTVELLRHQILMQPHPISQLFRPLQKFMAFLPAFSVPSPLSFGFILMFCAPPDIVSGISRINCAEPTSSKYPHLTVCSDLVSAFQTAPFTGCTERAAALSWPLSRPDTTADHAVVVSTDIAAW